MGQDFEPTAMNICVVGYYFNRELYKQLSGLSNRYAVNVVCHRSPNGFLLPSNLKASIIQNIGLEFHVYNHYLQNIWVSGKTLFMHDDIVIEDPSVFEQIEQIDKDCAYLFRDEAESKANGGKHGRIVLMSDQFLRFVKSFECDCEWCHAKNDPHNIGSKLPLLKKHVGFWYDPYNTGHISGRPPFGVRHYNSAIEHFHWFLGRVRDRRCGPAELWPCPSEKFDVVNRIYFSDLISGRRNCWKHVEREIKAYRLANSAESNVRL